MLARVGVEVETGSILAEINCDEGDWVEATAAATLAIDAAIEAGDEVAFVLVVALLLFDVVLIELFSENVDVLVLVWPVAVVVVLVVLLLLLLLLLWLCLRFSFRWTFSTCLFTLYLLANTLVQPA